MVGKTWAITCKQVNKLGGISFLILFLSTFYVSAQSPEELKPNDRKRFIDKVEVFVGPSLCFNYGNKFIENYEDDNVQNIRKPKVGYSLGLGFYHPVKDWMDINLRFSYEDKGTKSQMNTPGLKVNSEYTYKYLMVSIAPKISIWKKKASISLGGYYSRIQSAKGEVAVYDTQNNDTFISDFNGRQIRELRSDGTTSSITFVPNLQSFEKYDFGLVISASYLIRVNSTNYLEFSIQDNYGLHNINKQLDITDNPPEKNHSLTLTIGYILKRPLKKQN